MELGEILKYNPREVRFVDRTFNDNRSRALAIWQFLVAQDCDTCFHFEISPDRFSEEMFAFLEEVEPGRFEFEIGVQSTNQKTLDAIGRPVDIKRAHDAVSRLAGLNTIHLHVDLILGLPFETKESFYRSFAAVFAMKAHYLQMGILKMLPDVPMRREVDSFAILHSEKIPYTVLANLWIDAKNMARLYWFSQCVERFVNNRYFVSLWPYMRKNGEDVVAFFRQLHGKCEELEFFAKSPTQESLTEILANFFALRKDREILMELLCYDWLRCGHKFLPSCLQGNRQPFRDTKRDLFAMLSQKEEAPLSGPEMTYCFKKGLFVEFSAWALSELGYAYRGGQLYLCFLPDREESLYRHCKALVFSV